MNTNLYFDKIEEKLDKMSDKEFNLLLMDCELESESIKMEKTQESIFDNMSDKEFEQLLIDCGFEFKKVEQGEGGLIIKQSRRSR